MNSKVLIALGSVPKDGGTFTFYQNIRPELLKLGFDLRCVTVGKQEASLVQESYSDSGCVLLAEYTYDIKNQAIAFSDWCHREGVSIVIALNSLAILSSLPYLDKSIRVVSRCANAFDEGYRVTMSCAERIMAIVALTPRLQSDLLNFYSADPAIIELIPNGISPLPFDLCIDAKGDDLPANKKEGFLNLAFVGRLEHKQKGVLYLPDIVEELFKTGIPFKLRVAGKGRHENELRKQLKHHVSADRVEFIGVLNREQIPPFLCGSDVFLFTSHFEGCPNALLEAMMAGCVPVVYSIPGITDFILQNGHTGFIAPMGDSKSFASYISALSSDTELLLSCSKHVATDARRRFAPEIAAKSYASVFNRVISSPLPDFTPLSWDNFKVDEQYRWRWTQLIPAWLKERVKRSRFWAVRC